MCIPIIHAFACIQLVGMLGLGCVGPDFNYRLSLLFVSAIPLFIIAFAFIGYRCQLAAFQNIENISTMTKVKAAENLFHTTDADDSGHIDEAEFQELAVFLRLNPAETDASSRSSIAILKRASQKPASSSIDATRPEQSETGTISLRQFIEAAKSGELSKVLGTNWVALTKIQSLKSSYMSGVLMILFLLHSPVSQRMFFYFRCHGIGKDGGLPSSETRNYLRADYRIRCDDDAYFALMVFVVAYICAFTLMLPMTVALVLFYHRRDLHSVQTRQKYGFLYAPFNAGSEFWELWEVLRKILLTGIIAFVPGSAARAACAIIVCTCFTASLNYYRPHRNKVVFWVAEASFLLSTFKYLVAVVLLGLEAARDGDSGDGFTDEDGKASLGWLLISLDIIFMVSSLGAIVVVFCLLRKSLKKINQQDRNRKNSLKSPVSNIRVSPLALSKSKLDSGRITKL